ncbi:SGNH/GDSL hydrolase family protein [Limnohabitans sp. Jir72]|uniref:SGNH/GDSL hydrolase family protein n=1 Tax=Limnohabitans sp. Jir72 TaxID=1977909 RepID=UPI000D3A7295|nr:SGNH/GDSL hydrolase family protein [Limnohabitans sp. Jir72]PUE31902.1 PEP-CTERM sorting domain-containing protein [Limnohabitans sp. Jir72]
MKFHPIAAALLSSSLVCIAPVAQAATSVLFIGNSFTYGHGSAVRFYRADTVRDLNREGQGGVPALFKSFTQQVGLDYDVAIETRGGTGIDWHVLNRLSVITQQPWDMVVAHGFSTLDAKKPGNPDQLVKTALELAQALQAKNPKADLRLEATFPRADETYGPKGAWYGKTIGDMAKDVRAGYDLAAKSSPVIKGVIPVGEAWVRAMDAGVADNNSLDGIDPGKLNLWTYDHYHASVAGYYLKGLVVFGALTLQDPRALGGNECSGFELGLSVPQIKALQQVAYEQLKLSYPVKTAPLENLAVETPQRCLPAR